MLHSSNKSHTLKISVHIQTYRPTNTHKQPYHFASSMGRMECTEEPFLLEELWDNCYRWLNSDTPMKQQHVLGKEKKELYLRRNVFTRTFNNKVSRNVQSCDVTFCRPLTLRRPYRSSKCKYCQFCQWVPSLYAVNINWLGKHLGVRWGMEGTYTTHGDLFFAVRV